MKKQTETITSVIKIMLNQHSDGGCLPDIQPGLEPAAFCFLWWLLGIKFFHTLPGCGYGKFRAPQLGGFFGRKWDLVILNTLNL